MTERTVVPDIASLQSLVGKELGPSSWVTVSQDRIDAFAEATGDRQWIHCDPERARRESPFGSTIAHGHLTLSLAPALMGELLEVRNVRLLVNPGFERIRLRAPVKAGERVRLRITLTRLRELRGGSARATFHMELESESEPRPVAVGDVLVVYYL